HQNSHYPHVILSTFHGYGAPRDLPSFPTRRSSDLRHVVAARAQVAAQDVDGDERARMADVRARVGRDAAPVHTDLLTRARDEKFLAAAERVREDQAHARYSSSSRSFASTE